MTKFAVASNPWTLKYRPRRFKDVVGQDNAVAILQGMLKRQEIPNALLLAGPYGSGKTTLARILARYVNCEEGTACGKCKSCKLPTHPDVSELDAAEQRGIDEIRNLLRRSRVKPMHSIRFFILDEVQQLTSQASGALLKSLEEPGPTTCYVLCTNEPHKVPDTVLSRCQRIMLNLPTRKDIATRLSQIAERESVKIKQEVLDAIAESSGGHMRDAVSLLQSTVQLMSSGETNPSKLIASVGQSTSASSVAIATKVLVCLYKKSYAKAAAALLDFTTNGEAAIPFVNMMLYMNEYALAKKVGAESSVWHTPNNRKFWETASKFVDNSEQVLTTSRVLLEMRSRLQYSGAPDRSVLLGLLTWKS